MGSSPIAHPKKEDMKRNPYNSAKHQYAWKYNCRRNFKDDEMETNSKVISRKRRNKFQSWADGYAPMGLIQGRRGRPTKYKDKRKGRLG